MRKRVDPNLDPRTVLVEIYLALERAGVKNRVERARALARTVVPISADDASRWLAKFTANAPSRAKRDGRRFTGSAANAPTAQRADTGTDMRADMRADMHEENGRERERTSGRGEGLTGADKVSQSISSPSGSDSEIAGARASATVTPLFPEVVAPPAPSRSKKAVRVAVASAYAGTTFEHFGEAEPTVREVIARDAAERQDGKLSERFIADALGSLARWRDEFGDDAFEHGLCVALDRGLGHRYAGGVMRRYDPERDGERRRFISRQGQPTGDPTLTELYESGQIEPPTPEENARMVASRPAWFNAQLAARAAAEA